MCSLRMCTFTRMCSLKCQPCRCIRIKRDLISGNSVKRELISRCISIKRDLIRCVSIQGDLISRCISIQGDLISCVPSSASSVDVIHHRKSLFSSYGTIDVLISCSKCQHSLVYFTRDLNIIKRDLISIKRDLISVKRDLWSVKRDPISVKRDLKSQHPLVHFKSQHPGAFTIETLHTKRVFFFRILLQICTALICPWAPCSET